MLTLLLLLAAQPAPLLLQPGDAYRLQAKLTRPAQTATVHLQQNNQPIATKQLHPYDWQWTQSFRATSAATISAQADDGVQLTLEKLPTADPIPAIDPAHAETILLDRAYHFTSTERPYLPQSAADLAQGVHWFKIRPTADKLVFLHLTTPNPAVPMDVDLFNAQLEPWREGADTYRPEATQNLPGLAAFRPRRLHAGQAYYVRVHANHATYRLELRTYNAPPYQDPRQAVRTGLDYLVSLGGAWLNNIPRRGSVASRATLAHAETQNCVACHPTQFTTRAAITAMRQGYAAPVALPHLLDQLENNPRPLPGHPDTNWSRMIFSARTVSSRLPLLLAQAGRPRPDLIAGAVNYLELHYADRQALAEEEADGASPAVSPLEIALQSWQLYGLHQAQHPRRAQLAQWIEDYEPRNLIDLNWKIIALTELGRPADAATGRLLEQQQPDGRFPGGDFISYHALYALARAGRSPSDPSVAKLLAYTLRQQQPWGAWQGEPGARAFSTPFRESQFAIMALATLFPEENPKTNPEQAKPRQNPSPRDLQSPDPHQRLAALEAFTQHFRAATKSPELKQALTNRLQDTHPLLRLMAAQALARWSTWDPDPEILDHLCAQLQNETEKPVRKALQEAIYTILDDNIGYAEAWMRAMSREADRQRTASAMHARNAAQARILAQHLERANRETKLALTQALWDLPLRHMGIPESHTARTEVVLPAYYAEYRDGVPDLTQYPPYQQANAFTYNARNNFYKTRIGNDSDLPDLTGAGPELETALAKILEGDDTELAISAVKAASILGNSMTPAFSAAALRRLTRADDGVAQAIRYVFANGARAHLTLGTNEHLHPALRHALIQALDHPHTHAVVLPFIAGSTPGSRWLHDAELRGAVERWLRVPQPSMDTVRAAVLFPRLADGPLMRTVMMNALASNDREREAEAVEVVVRSYFADPTLTALAEQFGRATRGRVRRRLVDSLDPERFALNLSALSLYQNPGGAVFLSKDANLFTNPVVKDFLSNAITDSDTQVQTAALELARQQPALKTLLPPTPPAPPALDFTYFVEKVQPLLAHPGADGRACVHCHSTHAAFPLRLPVKGQFTDAQSRENFAFAQRVVNQQEPRKSLILVKPTRPNDSAGDPNLFLATHNGGERWTGNDTSPAYETILAWIRGARSTTSTAASGAAPKPPKSADPR